MIPWWSLIIAFVAGILFAIVLIALMTLGPDDTNDDDDTL